MPPRSDGLILNSKVAHLFTKTDWRRIVLLLRLSNREAQILMHVFEDMKDLAIATDLCISTHTVHTHFERMYRKLGVRDRCSLLVRVFETCLTLRARSPRVATSSKHAGRLRGRRRTAESPR